MSLNKLNEKQFSLGLNLLPRLKDVAKKVNEIIDYITGDIKPYKSYVALLTQSADEPIATVLQNDFDQTLVWAKSADGTYTTTISGGFSSTKTVVFLGSLNDNVNTGNFWSATINAGTLTLMTGNLGGIDGILSNTPIEIRVYN